MVYYTRFWFRFEIDSGAKSRPDALYITISSSKQKLLFEMLPGKTKDSFSWNKNPKELSLCRKIKYSSAYIFAT